MQTRGRQLVERGFLPAVKHEGHWYFRRQQVEVIANARESKRFGPTSLGEAAALASLFDMPIERFFETPKEVWGHLQLAGIAHELASKATELAALEERRRALTEEAEELQDRYAGLVSALAKAAREPSGG